MASRKKAPADKRTLDLLNDAVASCHLKSFTAENVLRAFAEEGIRSLEDLAKRVVATTCHPEARPQRVSLEQITRPTPAKLLATIVHRPPKLPFYVNGVEYEPADIARFNGRALHTVVSGRGRSPELIAFEEHSTFARLVELLYMAGLVGLNLGSGASGGAGLQIDIAFVPPSVTPPPPDSLEPPPRTQGSGSGSGGIDHRVIRMYEHVLWGGDSLELGPMLAYSDLTKVGRGFLGLGDWNDIISSLWLTHSHVVCWEHTHHQGSALITGRYAHFVHDNLVTYGWNDRISSVLNCG